MIEFSGLGLDRWWVVIPGLIVVGWSLCQMISRPQTLGRGLTQVLRQVASGRRELYRGVQVCLLLIILCSILLLMKPVIRSTSIETSKEGIDIVLALDVSGSMGADDFQPDRLSVAKGVLQDFVEQLSSDRVGLVVFAGQPFVSVPLTFDYQITQQIIDQTSTETINQQVRGLNGTAIGDAVVSSLSILEKGLEDASNTQREQVVVLVTDGEATPGSLDPLLAARYAQEQDVTIYTVGVGSLEGGSIEFRTPLGGVRRQPVGGVDEEMLQQIAQTSGGRYWRATNDQTFQSIFDELSELTKTEVTAESVRSSVPALQRLERVILLSAISVLIVVLIGYTQTRDRITRLIQLWSLTGVVILGVIVVVTTSSGDERPAVHEYSVLLDVSRSMQVQDIQYRDRMISRLQAAKTLIQRMVDRIDGASWGIQVFAGGTTSVLPISTDRELFLTFLQGVDRESVTEGGSDLSEAIMTAVERFVGDDETVSRSLIVVSDGGEEEVVIDQEVTDRIENMGIQLIIVGVGTPEGGPIVQGVDRFGGVQTLQYQGETVISRLGEEYLRSVAYQTNGLYEKLDSVGDIDSIINVLSNNWLSKYGMKFHGSFNDILLILVILMINGCKLKGWFKQYYKKY